MTAEQRQRIREARDEAVRAGLRFPPNVGSRAHNPSLGTGVRAVRYEAGHEVARVFLANMQYEGVPDPDA